MTPQSTFYSFIYLFTTTTLLLWKWLGTEPLSADCVQSRAEHVTLGSAYSDTRVLQERKHLRLVFLYNVVEGSVPVIPREHYVIPQRMNRAVQENLFVVVDF